MTKENPLAAMSPEAAREAVKRLITREDAGQFLNEQLEKLVAHGVRRDVIGEAIVAMALTFLTTANGYNDAAELLERYARELRTSPLNQVGGTA